MKKEFTTKPENMAKKTLAYNRGQPLLVTVESLFALLVQYQKAVIFIKA